jgi:DNA polymerase III sliding clamp (beta) subunit (PCNA family)
VDDRGRLHVGDDAGRYVVSAMECEAPKVDKLWTMDGRTPVTLDRRVLVNLVKHLEGVRDKKALAPLRFHFAGHSLILSVRTADMLDATRTMPYDGGCVDFALNGRMLADMLGSLTADGVTFHVADALKPIVWTEGDYTALQMPVRV